MGKQDQNIFEKRNCLSMKEMMDYVHDRLESKGMNRVERHLQSCDFCSEAMEGIMLLKDKEEKAYNIIEEVNSSINKNSSSKIRWFVAASFALAVLAGGLAYLNSGLNPDQNSVVSTRQESKTLNTDSVKISLSSPVDSLHNPETGTYKLENGLSLEKSNKSNSHSFGYHQNSDGILYEKEEAKNLDYEEGPSSSKSNIAGSLTMRDTVITANANIVKPSASLPSEIALAEKDSYKENLKRKADVSEKKSRSKTIVPTYSNAPSKDKSAKSDIMMEDDRGTTVVSNGVGEKNGIDLYNQKNYSEAIKVFESILKQNSDSSEVIYYNGLSYYQLKNYDKALLNFSRIKKGNKYFEDAEQMKVNCYLAKGDKDKAKELLNQIILGGGKYKTWAEGELKKLQGD